MESGIIIRPSNQYRVHEYDRTRYSLECDIIVNGNVEGEITGASKDVLNISKWQEMVGYDKIPYVDRDEFNVICSKFFDSLRTVRTKDEYRFKGWNKDKNCYILSDCFISKDKIYKISTASNYNLDIDSRPDTGEVCDYFMNSYFKVLKHTEYPKILLCVSLLSMYTSILQEQCEYQPNFATYVQAGYNKGKSSSINAMINPWKIQCCSFEDTEAAIVQTMKENKDIPLIIDDMSKSKRPGMIAKCERIIRLSGDTATSAQKMVGGKVNKSMVKCMTVITGEELPCLQDSSYTRMLILKYDNDEVNWDVLTLLQKNTDYTLWFYINFIQHYMQQDGFVDELIDSFLNYRAEYRVKFKEHNISNRYVDMISWILSMWNKVNEFFCSQGHGISNDTFKNGLESLIVKLGSQYSHKSPAQMFLKGLFELINTNKMNFVTYSAAKNSEPFDIIQNQNEFFVKSGTVYEKVKKYYENNNIDFNYTEAAIRKDLNNCSLIKHSRKLLTSEFKTIENKSISGFWLLAENAKKYINQDLEDQKND